MTDPLPPKIKILAFLRNISIAVLAVTLAWILAGLFWGFAGLEQNDLISNGVSENPIMQVNNKKKLEKPVKVVQAPLFGEVKKSAKIQETITRSSAPYRISGIFHNSIPALSQAVLVVNGNKSRVYASGDKLPGGEIIAAIKPFQVILLKGAKREALILPQKKLFVIKSVVRLASTGTRGAEGENRSVPRELPYAGGTPGGDEGGGGYGSFAIPRAILNDKKALIGMMSNIELSFVKTSGGRSGISLNNIASVGFIRTLGLRKGDIVTAINGFPVKDRKSFASILNVVSKSEMIRIEYSRGGESTTLSVSLGDERL